MLQVDFADSVPPMPYGGNLDNRRIDKGATMYYPVAVAGALLSMGDAHLAQGTETYYCLELSPLTHDEALLT